jgi:hypothetical protein
LCCILSTLLLVGPRAAVLIWWILDTALWSAVFNHFIWPLLGFILLPWVTLGYVIAERDGVFQWYDWIVMAVALLLDFSAYYGGVRNRQNVPYVTQ